MRSGVTDEIIGEELNRAGRWRYGLNERWGCWKVLKA